MKNTVNTGHAGAIKLDRRRFLVGTAGLAMGVIAGCDNKQVTDENKGVLADIRNYQLEMLYQKVEMSVSKWKSVEGKRSKDIQSKNHTYRINFSAAKDGEVDYMEIIGIRDGVLAKDFHIKFDQKDKFTNIKGNTGSIVFMEYWNDLPFPE